MNKIMVNYCPFMFKQNISVISEGEIVHQEFIEIDGITDMVRALKNEYNVDKIILCGNNDYLTKFKAELSSKFDHCDIEILSKEK